MELLLFVPQSASSLLVKVELLLSAL